MENFIRVYDAMLSDELCAEAIKRFELSQQTFPGLISKNDGQKIIDRSKKQTMELVISDDPAWVDIEQGLQAGYVECVNRYAAEFPHIGRVVGTLFSEPFRFKKYEPGGFFDWHVDSGGENNSRVVAVQFYFNDVDKGGETEFMFQKMRVPAVRGRMIVFPTLWTYLHRGAPVHSNPKYICTNYVRSDEGGGE